jgi:hypothetical protein
MEPNKYADFFRKAAARTSSPRVRATLLSLARSAASPVDINTIERELLAFESSSMYLGVERRMNPRLADFSRGVIGLGRSKVECIVRDLSLGGAGLLAPDLQLPAEFDLVIFGDATRHCISIWRDAYRMGVQFK